MKYLSVCSGIEAATVAWHPLGWEAVAYSEIERFPSEVLAHHYPNTPNLGDMTKFKEWNFESNIDLIVGGTPCQSFSVAGLRKGLDDPRGNLTLVYLAIAEKLKPKWLVWENVPGVLSSDGGKDFGTFLGGLAELGYGFAYRICDAQHFGVAQRRRRVFVVANLGDWRDSAGVLFERQVLPWHPTPSQRKGKETTIRTTTGDSFGYKRNDRIDVNDRIVNALCASDAKGVGNQYVADHKCVVQNGKARRLTPIEFERLQGFPDGYTDIKSNGKATPDGVRYKSLGNSMAVPVMAWIGQRISQVENIKRMIV